MSDPDVRGIVRDEMRRGPAASATQAAHRALRKAILHGELAPGSVLKQTELGRLLGVSATPVREALRMLHEEGLVVAYPQHRARVVGFDPRHVEALYAERISVEAVGAGLTADRADDGLVAELREAYGRMEHTVARPGPSPRWHDAHRDFHLASVRSLGAEMIRRVAANIDRSRHYVLMHRSETTDGWTAPSRWHAATLAAFEVRDEMAAVRAVAEDLGNAAEALIRFVTPEYEPDLIVRTRRLVGGAEP